MRGLVTSASVVCLFILTGLQGDTQDALKKEVDLLRGSWTLAGGNAGEVQFVIYGKDGFEINIGGNRLNGVHQLDPAKKPKEITLTPERANKSLLGIYKLEGGTLTLCFGEKRPAAFQAKAGTLWVLKREKRR